MGIATHNTWNARREMRAPAEAVIAVLTDPEACGQWSPIDFEVEELDGRRLVAGTRARVAGKLAGARVSSTSSPPFAAAQATISSST